MSELVWVLASALALLLLPLPLLMWAAVSGKKRHSREAAMKVLELMLNTVVKVLELVLNAVVRLMEDKKL